MIVDEEGIKLFHGYTNQRKYYGFFLKKTPWTDVKFQLYRKTRIGGTSPFLAFTYLERQVLIENFFFKNTNKLLAYISTYKLDHVIIDADKEFLRNFKDMA